MLLYALWPGALWEHVTPAPVSETELKYLLAMTTTSTPLPPFPHPPLISQEVVTGASWGVDAGSMSQINF